MMAIRSEMESNVQRVNSCEAGGVLSCCVSTVWKNGEQRLIVATISREGYLTKMRFKLDQNCICRLALK